MFDVHWLYRKSHMPSLRLMSLNVMMLLNAKVMSSQYGVSNESDCIIKNPRSEMKGMQEKISIICVRDR